MQAGPSERTEYSPVIGRPTSPKRCGSTAVQPAATTRRPNSASSGVMPGRLAHDDHRGAAAQAEHVPPLAFGLEALLGVVPERAFPPARIAGRHGRTVASSAVSAPLRSFEPRLPVVVGLGAVSESAPVAELMTRAVEQAAADAGAPRTLGLGRPRRGAARIVVAHGSRPHRGPAHRLTGGAHDALPGRRVATGTGQPRPGRGGGRRVRHRGRGGG